MCKDYDKFILNDPNYDDKAHVFTTTNKFYILVTNRSNSKPKLDSHTVNNLGRMLVETYQEGKNDDECYIKLPII